MRLIAVSQRVDIHPTTHERRDALDQRWAPFLSACGLIGVALPNHRDQAQRLLDRADFAGVLLTGGNDLAAYGGDAPERDEVELALIDWAVTKSFPLLGVCRGMQLIQYRFGVPLERVTGHAGTQHLVEIDGEAVETNSYHQFAATHTVPELKIRGRARDGVVEAIKHTGMSIYGVMWHPERCARFAEHDVRLFREIFGVDQ